MKIVLIGYGAIARYVTARVSAAGHSVVAVIARAESRARIAQETGLFCVTSMHEFSGKVDLFVDCAGHAALRQHGAEILRAGHSLVTVSIGALADRDLEKELQAAALAGGGELHLASGAIGGLDTLRAARAGRLDHVRYIGRKPPAGWKGSPAEDVLDLGAPDTGARTHFSGSARDAALRYPKNANVAAAVALAGLGFEQTEVQLVSDTAAAGNIHRIEAEGDFGQFVFEITGKPLPDNPRSSALAAMSAVASVLQCAEKIRF